MDKKRHLDPSVPLLSLTKASTAPSTRTAVHRAQPRVLCGEAFSFGFPMLYPSLVPGVTLCSGLQGWCCLISFHICLENSCFLKVQVLLVASQAAVIRATGSFPVCHICCREEQQQERAKRTTSISSVFSAGIRRKSLYSSNFSP